MEPSIDRTAIAPAIAQLAQALVALTGRAQECSTTPEEFYYEGHRLSSRAEKLVSSFVAEITELVTQAPIADLSADQGDRSEMLDRLTKKLIGEINSFPNDEKIRHLREIINVLAISRTIDAQD